MLLLAPASGCSRKRVGIDDPDARQMVELLMPQRIKIVEAFTKFRSFDEDELPDGIELMLQPVDSFGDPVKIAGTIRVELYTYLAASGNREGTRVCDPWEVELLTEDDQEMFWHMVTGMYEIPLEFPAGVSSFSDKYLLKVTYGTPLSSYMTDECVLDMPVVG